MANVDLYDSSYGHYALTAYGEIRRETYGEDYGQTSWVTTAESYEIPKLLKKDGHVCFLTKDSEDSEDPIGKSNRPFVTFAAFCKKSDTPILSHTCPP